MEKSFFTPQRSGPAGAASLRQSSAACRRARQNQPAHAAAANQAVVPAEIVVEHHVERGGLAGLQGFFGARVNLGFEAAAAERAGDFAVGKKQRLGADALRAGTFRAGNQRQHEWPALVQRGDQLFVKSRHNIILSAMLVHPARMAMKHESVVA